MNSRYFSIFLLLLLSILVPSRSYAPVVDRIVAVVNNQAITLSELMEAGKTAFKKAQAVTDWEERTRVMEGLKREILDQLIDGILIEDKARREKIEVKEEEIDRAIEAMKKQNALSHEELLQALEEQGLTYEQYREKMRKSLLKIKLVNKLIRPKITITEKDIKEYFEKNKESYTGERKIRLSHISIPIPEKAEPQEIEALEQKAQKILDRIKKGEDFASLARKFSKAPSAVDGGDMGYFKKGELNPSLEKIAFQLKVGEVSDVIRLERSFEIIKVTAIRGGDITYQDVRAEIEDILLEKELRRRIPLWMEQLRKENYVDIRL